MRPNGAQTRFNNDRVRAAQQSMGGNIAARSAFKTSYAPSKPTGRSPVGTQMQQPQGSFMGGKPPFGAVPQMPQGGAQAPQGNPETPLARLIEEINLDKLINSSEMHDAFVKVKLRDKYNGRDSGDDIGRQVLEILTAPLNRVG